MYIHVNYIYIYMYIYWTYNWTYMYSYSYTKYFPTTWKCNICRAPRNLKKNIEQLLAAIWERIFLPYSTGCQHVSNYLGVAMISKMWCLPQLFLFADMKPMRPCPYIYIYSTNTHTHIYIYIYMYVCVCICSNDSNTYMYIYIYII